MFGVHFFSSLEKYFYSLHNFFMYRIRNAQKSDLDKIMQIESESFIPQISEKLEVFEKRLQFFQKGFLVFEDVSSVEVFGYFSSELWKDFPRDFSSFKIGHDIEDFFFEDGKNLYISSFAILKKMRGKGIGKKLFQDSLNFIEKLLKNDGILLEKTILLVNETWLSARHIYENSGFKISFTIKDAFENSFGKTDSGIVMVK